VTRRAYLTRKEWDALLAAQGGKCACGCGATPADGRFEADHSVADAYDRAGRKPDQLLLWRCHQAKSKKDVREIARAKRLSGEALSQYERRKRFGPSLKSRNTFQDRRNG
jgi:hypothetical protein